MLKAIYKIHEKTLRALSLVAMIASKELKSSHGMENNICTKQCALYICYVPYENERDDTACLTRVCFSGIHDVYCVSVDSLYRRQKSKHCFSKRCYFPKGFVDRNNIKFSLHRQILHYFKSLLKVNECMEFLKFDS